MKTHTIGNSEADAATECRGGDSPFVYEFFIVQGAGYRCMAYRDNNGTWRAAFNHRELPGMVEILA